jgi:hypothetical protein
MRAGSVNSAEGLGSASRPVRRNPWRPCVELVLTCIKMMQLYEFVMPGLVPGIHGIRRHLCRGSWMAGSSQIKSGHDD